MDHWKRFVAWCQRPGMITILRVNPSIGMPESGIMAAKAGARAGALYGPISYLLAGIGANIENSINNPLWRGWGAVFFDPEYPVLLIPSLIISLIMGLIIGTAFGYVFAAHYDNLPGQTSATKGIMVSIIYWVTVPLGLSVLSNLDQFFTHPYVWLPSAFALGPSILWGGLLGRFWERERSGTS